MKIAVVMPAYNAAATVARTVADIDRTNVSDIILVDDASSDNTVEVARGLGLRVIEHKRNTGYGGNQKTCYRAALETDADVIVMVHPDYQYDSRVIGIMAQIIEFGICDIVLGNRMRARREALDGGMPVWKYVSIDPARSSRTSCSVKRSATGIPGCARIRVPLWRRFRSNVTPMILDSIRNYSSRPSTSAWCSVTYQCRSATSPRHHPSIGGAACGTGEWHSVRWVAAGCTKVECGATRVSCRVHSSCSFAYQLSRVRQVWPTVVGKSLTGSMGQA